MWIRSLRPNPGRLRVTGLVILSFGLVFLILSTVFPFPEGTWDFLSIGVSQKVLANPDWLSGWSYRKALNITGQTGAGTNYQVKLRVGQASGAEAENFDVEGHCVEFPSDITFTDNDGTTELDYWLETVGGGDAFDEQDRVTITYPNDFDVYEGGNRTIVASDDAAGGLYLYNTSNKADITLIDSQAAAWAHDVKVIDSDPDWAYYCQWHTAATDYFGILDMTDEENLSVEDSEVVTNAFYCEPVVISEDIIVFVVTHDTAGGSGVYAYNCTDHTINLLDSVTGSGANHDFTDDGWRVKYHSGYQLLIVSTSDDGTDGAVSVIDASDPSDLTPLYKYEDGDWVWVNMFIEGNRVYGCVAADDKVVVCSIAADGQLAKLGEYQSTTYLDNVHGIFVEDLIIYVSAWGSAYDLSSFNATDPENITRLSSHADATLYFGHACIKNGDYVWYACANCNTVAIFEYDEALIGADCATFWVEVKDDLSSGTVPIYCYYGKTGESPASTRTDGQATFRAFEDFTDASQIFTIVGAHITHDTTNDRLDFTGMTTAEDAYAHKDMGAGAIDDFLLGFACKMTYSSVGAEQAMIGAANELDDAYNNDLIVGFKGVPYTTYQSCRANQYITTAELYGTPSIQMLNGSLYYYTLTRVGTTTTLKSYTDEARQNQNGSNSVLTSSTTAVRWLFAVASVNYADNKALGASYVDTIYLAKHVSPSPSFSAAGNEEAFGAEITNSPSSNDFGTLEINTTANTAIDYFTITNTGTCTADVTIYGTDATGGDDTWDLDDSGTPGENIYALKAGVSTAGNSVEYPTAADSWAVAPDEDTAQLAWADPTNAEADDAAYASVTVSQFDATTITQRLRVQGFGFSVPDVTILGIKVEIERYNDAGETAKDFRVQLLDANGALVGTNKADTVNPWDTSPTIKTYGGATDTWSASPTATMVNDADFGVVLSAQAIDDNADIYVDFIRVTVYYASGDFTIIIKEYGSTPYNYLVEDLAEDATQDWGLKLYMPTSLSGYDSNEMAATITLVASEAS